MKTTAFNNQQIVPELTTNDFVVCDLPMGTIDCPNVDHFLGEISNMSFISSNNYLLYYYYLYLHICKSNIIINNNSITLDTVRLQSFYDENILHTFPTFEADEVRELPNYPKIKGYDLIYIPSKIQRVIYNHVSKKDLQDIDKNPLVAEELIYLFLSKLNNGENDDYRNLSISYLSKLFFGYDNGISSDKTNKIINILKKGTELKGAVIECDNFFIPEVKSYGYKLTANYKDKGSVKYYFKSDKVKEIYKKHYYNQLTKAINNPIANNLLTCYNTIELPSNNEILNEAKRLVQQGYSTKKSKILKFRNKKSKDLDNTEVYSYVEDSVRKFNELTEDGYIIPIVCGEDAGGRVVDSFSLMPSWIRNIVKINGQYIKESDYSALHPNIAIKIHNGDSEYLTHQKVSEALNIDLLTVKINHLSFFNQQLWQMITNPVYKYYSLYDPFMLESIIKDKQKNGYKNITRLLFSMEVSIMTSVIKKLNEQYIYVGYIYDALFCDPTDFEIVKNTMNETIKEFGVLTIAK